MKSTEMVRTDDLDMWASIKSYNTTRWCYSSSQPISELRSVTCHMGSHSVTCHPTQVNAPDLNPS